MGITFEFISKNRFRKHIHTCIIEKLPYLVSLIMKCASPLNSYQKIVESTRSRSGVHPESTKSPSGVHQELSRSPPGVHQESIRSPPGVEQESTRSPPGVYPESTRSWGVHPESTRSLPRVHLESTRSPPGVYLESTWSLAGPVGECKLQQQSNKVPHELKLANKLSKVQVIPEVTKEFRQNMVKFGVVDTVKGLITALCGTHVARPLISFLGQICEEHWFLAQYRIDPSKNWLNT
jgi:hypothetical protein